MGQKPDKKIYIDSIIIFLIFLFAGILMGYYSSPTTKLINEMVSPVKAVQDWPDYKILLFIFLNNSIKALLAIVLGFFFAIFPVYFLASNSFLIGMVIIYSGKAGYKVVVAGLLPHGIFELYGIIFACSLGIWLGIKFYHRVFKNNTEGYNLAWHYALNKYFKIILPILLLAAVIETFITPKIIDLVLR